MIWYRDNKTKLDGLILVKDLKITFVSDKYMNSLNTGKFHERQLVEI